MINLQLYLFGLLFAGVSNIYCVHVEQLPEENPQVLPSDDENITQIMPGARGNLVNGLLQFFTPTGLKSKLSTPPIPKNIVRLPTPKEGCGFTNVTNTKIVGGQTAKPGAWPWIALLGYESPKKVGGYRLGCGGSLITSRHVLTAAHCVNTNLRIVRLGEFDLRTDTDGKHQDVKIARILRHGEFIATFKINDIAILELEHDVEFTDQIRPICLPVDGVIKFKSFVDTQPFIAGWGFLEEKGQVSPVLQQLQVPVLKNDVCEEKFKKARQRTFPDQFFDGVICAGHLSGGKDSCQGDSGGPLMIPIHKDGKFSFYQIGVVSYGIGCARPDLASIYTKVAYFTKWIKTALAS